MDLVNDLSSDVALAVFVEGSLRQKLGAQDAKWFIELIEAELERIGQAEADQARASAIASVTH